MLRAVRRLGGFAPVVAAGVLAAQWQDRSLGDVALCVKPDPDGALVYLKVREAHAEGGDVLGPASPIVREADKMAQTFAARCLTSERFTHWIIVLREAGLLNIRDFFASNDGLSRKAEPSTRDLHRAFHDTVSHLSLLHI